MQPCTVKGLAAAFSAGMLGYLFGFVPGVIRHRASKWALVHLDGVRSAQSFAVMSGAYTAVHCICQRIREVEDGWNRGLAGCATGLALGWGNGPAGALQSCAGIGGLSYLLDFGGTGAAEARGIGPLLESGAVQRGRQLGCVDDSSGDLRQKQRGQGDFKRQLRALVTMPPLAFLGQCCRVAYFDGCGCNGGTGGGLAGCCTVGPGPLAVAGAASEGGISSEQRRRRSRR
jgi:import inner membrane translocase subunit TIM22